MGIVSILPGGADYAPVASTVLAEELDRARQLVRFGASLLPRATRRFSDDEDVTYKVATSVTIGAIKTLHSVCCAAETGAGHDATVLMRSLFETAMVVQFLLREELEITYRDGECKPPRVVRARMVLAHEPRLKLYKYQQDCKQPPADRVLTGIPAAGIRQVEEWAAETERDLAPEWLKRLDENRYSYCGKSVRDIATFLEKPNDVEYRKIYHGLYSDMSRPAHGMSFMDHIKQAPGSGLSINWHDEPRLLVHPLDLAALFVVVCLQSLCAFCGYTPAPTDDLEELKRWFADSQQNGDERRPQYTTEHEPA